MQLSIDLVISDLCKSVRDQFLVCFVKYVSAVLFDQLMVCCSLETPVWLLHGDFRARDHSTLSNLSVHAGIEVVLNPILSAVGLGRFLLFIPKFMLGREKASLSRAERQP